MRTYSYDDVAGLAMAHDGKGEPSRDGWWSAKCPAHGGKGNTSLGLRLQDDGALVVHCFAQCDTESIKRGLGVWQDYDEYKEKTEPPPAPVRPTPLPACAPSLPDPAPPSPEPDPHSSPYA